MEPELARKNSFHDGKKITLIEQDHIKTKKSPEVHSNKNFKHIINLIFFYKLYSYKSINTEED